MNKKKSSYVVIDSDLKLLTFHHIFPLWLFSLNRILPTVIAHQGEGKRNNIKAFLFDEPWNVVSVY